MGKQFVQSAIVVWEGGRGERGSVRSAFLSPSEREGDWSKVKLRRTQGILPFFTKTVVRRSELKLVECYTRQYTFFKLERGRKKEKERNFRALILFQQLLNDINIFISYILFLNEELNRNAWREKISKTNEFLFFKKNFKSLHSLCPASSFVICWGTAP